MTKRRFSTETLATAVSAALAFEASRVYLGNIPAEDTELNFLFAAPWSHSLKVPTTAVGRTEVTFRRPTSGGNEIVIVADEAPFLWWIARDGVIIDEGGSTDTLAEAVTRAETAAAELERNKPAIVTLQGNPRGEAVPAVEQIMGLDNRLARVRRTVNSRPGSGGESMFPIDEEGIYYVKGIWLDTQAFYDACYTGPLFVSRSGRVDVLTDFDVMQWFRDEARSTGADPLLQALK